MHQPHKPATKFQIWLLDNIDDIIGCLFLLSFFLMMVGSIDRSFEPVLKFGCDIFLFLIVGIFLMILIAFMS